MRQRRRLGLALTSAAAAAGVACLAIASPAFADPAGNNGTVKIDHSVEVDDNNDNDIANRPHVDCDFQVRFYNFDKGQTADIIFTIHKPSGDGEELYRDEDKIVSDDEAGGGSKDDDAVFSYSGSDFGLEKYKEHPKQGYHVKLTIKSEGVPGGVKHKVFWIQNCETPTTPSSPPPTTTTPPSSIPPSNGGGGGGDNGDNGGLPVTGAAATTMALLGTVLIGGGAGLVWMRRRRDNITFTS